VTARFAEPIHGYYGPTMAIAVTEFRNVHGGRGPGFMLENTAVHPIATASALPGFGAEHAARMAALPHLARALVVLRDETRGRITVDGDGRPALDYPLSAGDRIRLHAGMRAIARAYLAAGAEEVWVPLNGAPVVRSEDDLRALGEGPLDPGRTSLLYAVHLFGGAVMGGEAATSVCDEAGRVRGVRGVVVSDASALPSNLGVNPQITVIANALRVGTALAAEAA
jgi:choline dehydrogenase-like flavoprotein